MGGDFGPVEIVPAAIYAVARRPALHLILVGKKDLLDAELDRHNYHNPKCISVQHASEIVGMHELPSSTIRNKKDSSMRVAINLVKQQQADACVSAGNTGALMAMARYVLKMLPGIDRPAICTTMPGIEGHTHVLDLGANVDSSSTQLLQFAVMGTELTCAVDNKVEPRVGLLNIGAEEIKGNNRVKQAATLLTASHLNYIGFVEGSDIYTGKVDVIVCDGFTGNIALKASEGVADFMKHFTILVFKESIYGRLAALFAAPILKSLKQKIDPRRYNGASLLGLRKIVIKSHGGADRIAFATAIEEAVLEVEKNVPERISARLKKLFEEGSAECAMQK